MPLTRARAAVVLALGAVAGCATLPACPAKGGPVWREVTSAHFRLRSDLGEADARETVRRLEEVRAAMLATVWPGAPDPPFRTEVVVVRSRIELMVFVRDPHVPPLIWGLRSGRPPLPASLLFAGTDYRSMRVLIHELAHDLSAWFMPMQPSWLSEGLATCLETLRYDRASGRALVGEPSRNRQSDSGAQQLPASTLLDGRNVPAGEAGTRFEDRAWLLVHYLINKRPQQFARLQTELIHLRAPADAWALALPDLPPSQLDAVLEEYRRAGQYTAWQLAVPVPEPVLAVRVMADAEAHAVRALMFETGAAPGVAPDRAAAQSETAEALAADPTNVEALAFRFFWFSKNARPDGRAALAQRAVGAHPDAWLAWLMVAASSRDDRARRTALARGLALAPEQPHLLSELARLDAVDGRWDETLLLATKASQVGERFGIGLPLRMLALAHVGRCAEAADLTRALEMMAPTALAGPVRRDWEKLRQTCDEAAAHLKEMPASASTDIAPP
jgi:Tfp pilus assembly protein PilF